MAKKQTPSADGAGQPKRDYEVGYGKPPKQHQFKPGQKANPDGRPKGSRSAQQEARALLDGTMTVTLRGRDRKMNRRKALMRSLYERAAKGNNRAAEILLKLDGDSPPESASDPTQSASDLTPEDLAILDDLVRHRRGEDGE